MSIDQKKRELGDRLVQFLDKETKELKNARCIIILTFEEPDVSPEHLEVQLAFYGSNSPEFYVQMLEKTKEDLLRATQQ